MINPYFFTLPLERVEEDFLGTGLRTLIRDYYQLLNDYISFTKNPIFVHTRKFI